MDATISVDRSAVVAGVQVKTGLYVGGRWRASEDASWFDVVDPSTGKVIAAVADATPSDAIAALGSAAAAQASWGRSSARRRAEILRAAFEAVTARREEFASVITAEMGRPYAQSLGEVDYGAEFLRWFAEQAAHVHGEFAASPNGDFTIATTRVPVGPSLLITPWNFPLAMGTRKIGAALAAGCTVIVKPAEQTPLTMALLVDVLAQAGVPDGVVNFVPTTRAADQSETLMRDARLRKVSFTGSTPVGSRLLEQAARNVMRSSMELGGNGPFLVLRDADVPSAVNGAMVAKFRNGGQSCVAANRFIVHEAVAEEFIEGLVKRTSALVVADGTAPVADIGPLIDDRQRQRVQRLVDDAVASGAQLHTGGWALPGDGYFYAPTVLTHVPVSAPIMREEVFGPVATVTVAASDDDAIDLANDTPFGLVAFVYTQNMARALDATSRLDAGMIGVNRGLVSEAGAPFGGIKASGLGREGGHTGIDEYLETKYLAIDTTVPA
ncbi:NAD-dependent succinate-semialdehyde dehydrogenase [Mycolicibacterium mengxianglii]|uniref:NAD-dependent succinate-semialdehyde dehydrogenase n=1 Tax=Mycolicibacterium mengxianglii TaxID=2736649 RepID=UPI0018D08E35|nr:NAD-dependent succinate-semialdehyde dehydrogenase [Mycolicibacterium mengxianglii]